MQFGKGVLLREDVNDNIHHWHFSSLHLSDLGKLILTSMSSISSQLSKMSSAVLVVDIVVLVMWICGRRGEGALDQEVRRAEK